MSAISAFFRELDEPMLAGFYEDEDRERFYRYCKAYAAFFKAVPLPEYHGEKLYPCGELPRPYAVMPVFSDTVYCDMALLESKGDISAYKDRIVREFVPAWQDCHAQLGPHGVGGNAYTHSIPNYKRIEREGLDSYAERIMASRGSTDFREGLLCLLDGIRDYHGRAVALLRRAGADPALLSALEKVPFAPAETVYEALVCRNFIYYMDLCDDPGRIDSDLIDLYRGEDVTGIYRQFFENVDRNNGWSAAIGPDYHPLTLQVLKAIRGMRRPSIELRTTEQMPEEIWQAAAEALATGCGQPAFYNEALYQKNLKQRFPRAAAEDLYEFNGGGCTETMLAGRSRVGSLDAGINLAHIFAAHLYDRLPRFESYDAYYADLLKTVEGEIRATFDRLREFYEKRVDTICQPMRTLFIDDCIDNGKDFNAGGARYNWSVINIAGMINVIDSLAVLREKVFTPDGYDKKAFVERLKANDETLLEEVGGCSCFGVDDDAADLPGKKLLDDLCDIIEKYRNYFGQPFLPASIQFATYADAGHAIPATPDGRRSGECLCDSVGAIFGRDKNGPTALLSSIAKLPLYRLLGTPVVNLRLKKEVLPQVLEPLVLGFFRQGGMQLQISCLSAEEMKDALVHPEKHENLIVRIGGYSEYFNRLDRELQQTVIRRTEHR